MKTTESPHSVALTVERLIQALDRHGVPLLARIDHGAAAAAAGLELSAEQVLLFGDARVGTLLMQADPMSGYDLPLRLLVWDAAGQTMIAYRAPFELANVYAIRERGQVLERMEDLLKKLVSEAISP